LASPEVAGRKAGVPMTRLGPGSVSELVLVLVLLMRCPNRCLRVGWQLLKGVDGDPDLLCGSAFWKTVVLLIFDALETFSLNLGGFSWRCWLCVSGAGMRTSIDGWRSVHG
jgi:hypothetical protein